MRCEHLLDRVADSLHFTTLIFEQSSGRRFLRFQATSACLDTKGCNLPAGRAAGCTETASLGCCVHEKRQCLATQVAFEEIRTDQKANFNLHQSLAFSNMS